MPNSSSSTLIWRRSIARTVPSVIGSSYFLPVRLSMTESDSDPGSTTPSVAGRSTSCLVVMPTSSRLAYWSLNSRSSRAAPVLRACGERLKVRHPVQLGEALLDLLASQCGDPLGAELLDVEGGEHRAVAHRPPQAGLVEGVPP